jgi:hypothetical protein
MFSKRRRAYALKMECLAEQDRHLAEAVRVMALDPAQASSEKGWIDALSQTFYAPRAYGKRFDKAFSGLQLDQKAYRRGHVAAERWYLEARERHGYE